MLVSEAVGRQAPQDAARAGLRCFIFIPDNLERGKVTVRNDKVMAVLLALGLMPLIVPVAALEVLR